MTILHDGLNRMTGNFSYLFLPHLHEGQSQEIVKKSIYLHEVLHEVFEKVLVSLVYLTSNE